MINNVYKIFHRSFSTSTFSNKNIVSSQTTTTTTNAFVSFGRKRKPFNSTTSRTTRESNGNNKFIDFRNASSPTTTKILDSSEFFRKRDNYKGKNDDSATNATSTFDKSSLSPSPYRFKRSSEGFLSKKKIYYKPESMDKKSRSSTKFIERKSLQLLENTTKIEHNLSLDAKKKNFGDLALSGPLVQACKNFGFEEPTEIQREAIPRILHRKNVACVSETGSGKTLAYLLPLVHLLKIDETKEIKKLTNQNVDKNNIETNQDVDRPEKIHIEKGCPSVMILVPTRELARQVLSVAKSLSYLCKFRSTSLTGGSSTRHISTRHLQEPIDIVIGTPNNMLDLAKKGLLKTHKIKYLVMDEADVLMEGGGSASHMINSHFRKKNATATNNNKEEHHIEDDKDKNKFSKFKKHGVERLDEKRFAVELKELITPLILGKPLSLTPGGKEREISHKNCQVILVGATLLQPTGRPEYGQSFSPHLLHGIWLENLLKKQGNPLEFVMSKVSKSAATLSSDGLPSGLKIRVVNSSKGDKYPSLRDVISEIFTKKNFVDKNGKVLERRCIVFCNSIDSCRATAHFIESIIALTSEERIGVSCLHGELPAHLRKSEWNKFIESDDDVVTVADKKLISQDKKQDDSNDDDDDDENNEKGNNNKSSSSSKKIVVNRIAVVTDIASRGLDPSSKVQDVILFDLPRSWTDFLHRAGRTARAGRSGTVTAIIGPGVREKNLANIFQRKLNR